MCPPNKKEKSPKKVSHASFAALLEENRIFKPTPAFRAQAHIKSEEIYRQANKDPLKFWETQAKALAWFKTWKKTLIWKPPFAQWFVGGKLNASYNCLDRHIVGSNRNKAALIWEGEPGDSRTLTYFDLYREVNQLANAMKSLRLKNSFIVFIQRI